MEAWIPLPYETTPIVPGTTARYVSWPPRAVNVETLGYIVDSNGRSYPRDIGRSSCLGKWPELAVIFQFGDTWAYDSAGNHIAGTSSTAAVAHDPENHPTLTSYTLEKDGSVPSFIPILPSEKDQFGKRPTLWCFGGIIEIGRVEGNVAAGWVYYRKGTHYYRHTNEYIVNYTGVAKVFYDFHTKKLLVQRPEYPLQLFRTDEPSFGTFSAVTKGDIAYLYGHEPDSHTVVLARVNTRWALDRTRYTYWDGERYQTDITKVSPVIHDMKHGAVYRSKLFEPNKGRDWVFVGCSSLVDNKVMIGVSAKIEGPFIMVQLIDAFPLIPMPANAAAYCVYPHPWAFKEEDGQLMITWSEGTDQGGVVAVKVQLAMTMDMGRPSAEMASKKKKKKKKKKSMSMCVMS